MPVKCIPITNASPGMTLAKPVMDENGRTLCGEKTVLTEKLIAQFQRNNINAFYVTSDEKLSDEQYEHIKSDIEKRFSKITPKNVLNNLKSILLERLEARR